MKHEFISKLDYSKILELIFNAKELIIVSAVSIHDELAIPLIEAKKRNVNVGVVLDVDEDNIRNGFGEITSIEKLENHGIKVDQIDGNLINFIITDDVGYFLFQQSKVFLEDAIGPNAVLMSDIIRTKLIAYYYQPEDEDDFLIQKVASNIDVKKSMAELDELDYLGYQSQLIIQSVNYRKVDEIKKKLELNPPLQPDLKRRINTYTAKVQFVELKFTGANFSTKKINIPKEALPFKDAELKKALETRLNLFDKTNENEDFKEFNKIKEKEDKIREKYLDPIKCRSKSIINMVDKENFQKDITALKKDIVKYKKSSLQDLEKEMLKRKKTIMQELVGFLKENPPKKYEGYDQLFLFEKIEDDAQQIVSKIKFPEASKLILDLELITNFYDLTFEDFRDEELIEEFRKKEILKGDELDDIVSIKNAFEALK